MRNKAIDLNNHLFEQLERLNDEDLTGAKLQEEIERSRAVVSVSRQIIDNGKLILAAKKHIDEVGANNEDLPLLLTSTESKDK